MADVNRLHAGLADELQALGTHIRKVTADVPARDSGPQVPFLRDPLYLTMLDTLRAMVFIVDDQGGVPYASPTAESIMGRSVDTLTLKHGFEWIHPDDIEELTAFTRRIREAQSPLQATFRMRHGDGHWVWLETSATRSFRVTSGAVLTVLFARDVSQRQEALRALRDSEERFRAMAENASDIVLEISGDGRILFASPHCDTFFGADPKAMVGQLVGESALWLQVPEEERKKLAESYLETLPSDRDPFECEFPFKHADGSLHWMHSSARSYERSDGSRRIVIMGRDVTVRVQAQREVAESERRHRVVADAAHDLISECDAEGRLIYASPSIETILGFKPEELEGTTPFSLTHPDDIDGLVEVFLKALKDQKPVRTGPYRTQHRDGSWRWLTSTGVAYPSNDGQVRYLSVTRDITEERRIEEERRRLEDHLQWTQKLESLGVLAGGIAHDFNNLLTPILGDASLALMDLPESSPAHVRLQRIQKAAHRAATLTGQMLAYAGKGPLVVEPVNLSLLVKDTFALLETAVASRAVLSLDIDPALPSIEGDAGQLTQVILNLTTNSAEALSGGRGAIRVRTTVRHLEADVALLGETLVAGPYVVLEVSDNGSGMDEATRSRIFDPFYTTKFTGRGLGLASVLGIVRGHGGGIEVESQPGEGTTTRVLFPTSQRARQPERSDSTDAADWRASGTILVVDDDQGVRELTADTLRRAGFDVLLAADGQQGVEIFRERADEIRAVLLDRTMPVVGGEEAFAQMRSIRKDARIILVSGYSRERAEEHLSGSGLAAFLQKPFLPTTLLDLLRSVLAK